MGLREVEVDVSIAAPAVAPSVPHVRRAVVERARDLGADEAACRRIALAVSEAATNAVLHAFDGRPGHLRASVERRGDEIEVVVADDGHGLVPRSDSPGMGLGLGLIAEVTDSLAIADAGWNGTTVRMTFAVSGPSPVRESAAGPG